MIELKLNPDNPRTISEESFTKLMKSLEEFPEMLDVRPIVYDENNVILGGNMRYRALKELEADGFKIKDSWFVPIGKVTDRQKREFVIKDNVPFGDWDYDLLANEWSDLPLVDWGIDVDKWTDDVLKEAEMKTTHEVVIECTDEHEQERIYNQLISEGYKCRILTL